MKKFKEVSTEKERKLKYEGFCTKCNKVSFFRLISGSVFKTNYRCIKCKNIEVINTY
ncbi:hypothetical protein Phi19:3_gp039 [Cellulophaga phage phi19:3]|uniref:Uncharacterized protein n=1 Tax=Cellulophaga phage phi19:3 TaxID=1327971 RepID=R9ZZQ5_9CAUD|nr:hypothetical protein Phi19:3_gp039 [Cellulophaga phage phi19:3]AGO47443.1 hypothetical protein Phi19:3_gp039 [Cellulophaga phage phi19:3]